MGVSGTERFELMIGSSDEVVDHISIVAPPGHALVLLFDPSPTSTSVQACTSSAFSLKFQRRKWPCHS